MVGEAVGGIETRTVAAWAPLGAAFVRRSTRWLAFAWGVLLVGVDFLAVMKLTPFPRSLVGLVALFVGASFALRTPGGAEALGWRRLSATERRQWMRLIGAAAVITLVAIAALVAASRFTDVSLWHARDRSNPIKHAIFTTLWSPIHEEAIYRMSLLPAAVATIGRWPAVALGASVFAVLHALYGNVGPFNIFGSVVLPLVFVRTGSLALTVLLHGLGNAALILTNLAVLHLV